MNRQQLWGVILAGGRGSRFWPWSQPDMPKQFLTIAELTDQQTLLQATYGRLRDWLPKERVMVVALASFAAAIEEQLPDIPKENLIYEPFGRNTAACVAVVSKLLNDRDPESAQLWLPSDHYIKDTQAFHLAVEAGLHSLQTNQHLITFGIKPRRPETGYGYIEVDTTLDSYQGIQVSRVAKFHEKPDRERAATYIESGNYLWNSGMFLWPTRCIVEELASCLPEAVAPLEEWRPSRSEEAIFLDKQLYEKLPRTSIDFGVMERSKRVAVVETPMVWSDVGGWEALYELLDKDADGNVLKGNNLVLHGISDSLVQMGDLEAVLVDVKDLVICYHKGKLLICNRQSASRIRQQVEEIEQLGERSKS